MQRQLLQRASQGRGTREREDEGGRQLPVWLCFLANNTAAAPVAPFGSSSFPSFSLLPSVCPPVRSMDHLTSVFSAVNARSTNVCPSGSALLSSSEPQFARLSAVRKIGKSGASRSSRSLRVQKQLIPSPPPLRLRIRHYS